VAGNDAEGVNCLHMRMPIRKSEQLAASKKQEEDLHMTPGAIDRMRRELSRLLEQERPEMIKEVQRTAEMGDFSENFAYQQAKHSLRRINSRIMTLEDKIKRAIPIRKSESDTVQLGSTVTVESEGKRMTFEIVGPHETNPMRGRISHQSPLGLAMIGHAAGESVTAAGGQKDVAYRIVEVT